MDLKRMKNYTWAVLFAAVSVFSFSSCNDDDDDVEVEPGYELVDGIFVYGKNGAASKVGQKIGKMELAPVLDENDELTTKEGLYAKFVYFSGNSTYKIGSRKGDTIVEYGLQGNQEIVTDSILAPKKNRYQMASDNILRGSLSNASEMEFSVDKEGFYYVIADLKKNVSLAFPVKFNPYGKAISVDSAFLPDLRVLTATPSFVVLEEDLNIYANYYYYGMNTMSSNDKAPAFFFNYNDSLKISTKYGAQGGNLVPEGDSIVANVYGKFKLNIAYRADENSWTQSLTKMEDSYGKVDYTKLELEIIGSAVDPDSADFDLGNGIYGYEAVKVSEELYGGRFYTWKIPYKQYVNDGKKSFTIRIKGAQEAGGFPADFVVDVDKFDATFLKYTVDKANRNISVSEALYGADHNRLEIQIVIDPLVGKVTGYTALPKFAW